MNPIFDGDKTVLEENVSKPSVDNVPFKKGTTILETYKVEQDPIETGGMGLVWHVHHTGWNVDLAMKQPRAEFFSTEENKAIFIGECTKWIDLGLHPNIVSCYYIREIGGIPTIFAEWMEGGSLSDWISDGRLYVGTEEEQGERMIDIAIQFARGLHYAHELKDANGDKIGMLHRDVKPGNLLLTKDGEAKVSDFGLAQARALLTMPDGKVDVPAEFGDTDKTVFLASPLFTPIYCSMEQMDGKILTRQTDIYSWAVSVLEMYLSSHPWGNGIAAGTNCRNYFNETKVPMPEQMKELLSVCLESDPENRLRDFGVVLTRLAVIYKAVTGSDYPRPESNAAQNSADSLNNRALSFLDLGMEDKAKEVFEQVLQSTPNHPVATYNSSLFFWATGVFDDEKALQRVKNSDDSGGKYAALLEEAIHASRYQTINEFAFKDCISFDISKDDKYAVILISVFENYRQLLKVIYYDLERAVEINLVTFSADVTTHSYDKIAFIDHDTKAVCSAGHYVLLICLKTGSIIKELSIGTIKKLPHQKPFILGAFDLTNDERFLLTANAMDDIYLIDLKKGRIKKRIKSIGKGVVAICFSADEKHVYSVSRTGYICRYKNLSNWFTDYREYTKFKSDQGMMLLPSTVERSAVGEYMREEICAAVFMKSKSLLVCAGKSVDYNIAVFDMHSLALTRELTGYKNEIKGLTFNSTEEILYSCNGYGGVKIWEIRSGRCLITFKDIYASYVVASNINPFEIFALIKDDYKHEHIIRHISLQIKDVKEIARWEICKIVPFGKAVLEEQKFSHAYTEAKSAIQKRNYKEAVRWLKAAKGCTGRQRDPSTIELSLLLNRFCAKTGVDDIILKGILHEDAFESFEAVGISPDGKVAVSTSFSYAVRIFNLQNFGCVHSFNNILSDQKMASSILNRIYFENNGSKALLATVFGNTVAVDLNTFAVRNLFWDIKSLLHYFKDGKSVLVLQPKAHDRFRNEVRKIDLLTMSSTLTFDDEVHYIVLDDNERYGIFVSFERMNAFLYDLKEEKIIVYFVSELKPVALKPCINTHSKLAVILLADNIIGIYHMLTGAPVFTITFDSKVRKIALTSKGDYLFAGLENGRIELFGTKDFQKLYTFNANSHLNDFTLSDDDMVLLTCGDKSIKVWNVLYTY